MDASLRHAVELAQGAMERRRQRRATYSGPSSPFFSPPQAPNRQRRSSQDYCYSPLHHQRHAPLQLEGHRFEHALSALSVSQEDLRDLLDQEGGLDALKQSLRDRGAVTNTLVKQGIHFYVMNTKKRRQTICDGGIDTSSSSAAGIASLEDDCSSMSCSTTDEDSL